MSKQMGSKLKKARQSLGLSIADIQRRTRIDQKYLIAIEDGELDRLPSPIYVRSYLRSYANIVGENPQLLLQSIILDKTHSTKKSTPVVNRKVRNASLSIDSSEKLEARISTPRHKVVLEKEDVSIQPQVSPFITQRTTYKSEPQEIVDEVRSRQSVDAVTPFSRKVTLPNNLPQPEELGIQVKKKVTKTNTILPSRRTVYKNNTPKKMNYGKIYTWVLIVAAVLLTIAIVYSKVYFMKPNAQSKDLIVTMDINQTKSVNNQNEPYL